MPGSPDDVLTQLIADCRTSGWASSTMPFFYFQSFARASGWEPVATRRGDPATSRLRPTTKREASPQSISAATGLGEQALHVDGAHLHSIPDIVVMHSDTPNLTPTRIWKPPFDVVHSHAVKHGVFLVGSGRQTFLATAVDDGGLRFDPHCMVPADKRARDASKLLTTYGDVHEHRWDKPNTLLFVHNRTVLHGRAKVADNDERELTRIAYKTGNLK
ncbi:TauD/TfdA family dioxygenase [Nocardia cyriacigeorgica]|uniref:TauD/TfdA family dioxygenase n=1 Tax=Nocardia cyriacigeorgica TaxID=135487 RepID=UPI0024564F4A|nr:TauD/TfdA family dioxygenase [Nocardia cyriacigeorgica]